MKWYKRDPDAAIAGMIGLTLEERGVYNTVIDLLYSRDGDLPSDDIFFARACECRPQMWRRIRDSLIAKGKLHFKTDGKLTANRVQNELESAAKLIAKMSHMGTVSAENRSKNKQPPPTACELQPQPQPHPEEEKKENIKKKEGARGMVLPEGWEPDEERLTFARQTLNEAEISEELAKFRDYWHARAGPGAKKRDWQRTFCNWIRNRKQFNGSTNRDNSASRAAGRLAEAAERGGFVFGPRPSLVTPQGSNVVGLLPQGRRDES